MVNDALDAVVNTKPQFLRGRSVRSELAQVTSARNQVALVVDLAGQTDRELCESVTAQCRRFGMVKFVKIHRADEIQRVSFALVDMATREQAFELAAHLGGSTFQQTVLIHLEQSARETLAAGN